MIGFIPAINLFHKAWFNLLGADPLKALEHELGEYALILLIFLLSFYPIRKFTGLNLLKFRRSIGLLSFWYVLFHFLTYLILDQQLIWDLIIKDISKRPYIIVGFLSFLILISLALTSNRWSIRYLGSGNWKKLHLLVYLSALLAVSHYLMLVKSWPIKPLLYFLFILLLIIFRFGLIKFLQKK
ncbi:MAG: sulfoxide reductase heme-binding subunit YedZ [Paracoccaceae bacterium]|nr:sulfoxide reductase heme-binding subunit YedZ [Paracoccaceae bacterium]